MIFPSETDSCGFVILVNLILKGQAHHIATLYVT
jgi:hypothetical protein